MSWKAFIAAFSLLFALSSIKEAAAAPLQRQEIRFRIGKSAVDSCYKKNAATLDWAKEQLSREGLKRITIRAAASPEGSTALNRRLARERAEAVVSALREIAPSLGDSLLRIEVTGEDWNGVAAAIRRSNEPWKDEALEIVRCGGEQRKALLQDLYVGEAWDALKASCFPNLRKVVISFAYDAETAPSPAGETAGSAAAGDRISFPDGIGWVHKTYAGNAAYLRDLQQLVKNSTDTLYIKGYASPDGDTAANLALTRKRAESVRRYLVAQGYPESWIVVSACGEDWNGLKEAVKADTSLDKQNELLDILDNNTLSASAKKTKIRALDKGKTWQMLKSRYGAQLRCVTVSTTP